MKIPPPICRSCLLAGEEAVSAAPDGVLLLFCSHLGVLVRLTIAGGQPVHWLADHPVNEDALRAELAASRREAHRDAN